MSKKRPLQIAVLGSDSDDCTEEQYSLAFEVGKEVARKGAITLTGGGEGVMEAALKGAKEEGGLTVGVIPEDRMDEANEYCEVVIASGIGLARDEINVASAHGVILVGGGAGTLNEASIAYIYGKPIVALSTSGGTAAKVAGQFLDERETEQILSADSPGEAVEKLLKEIELHEDGNPHGGGSRFTN